jgi:uncharacterized protein (DUF1919 family)
VIGIINDFQGAFTFKQLTEEFTIPQVQLMLKDRPYMDYSERVPVIRSAEDFMKARIR